MIPLQNVKNLIGTKLLPLARLYLRYFPFACCKQFLWDNFSWRGHRHLAYTREGVMVTGGSLDLVQSYVYYFGIWEPNLTKFIFARLKGHTERTFVDVGANVGYFSLLAARQLKKGKVVAIEAFPSIFEKCLTNIKLNRATNVRVVPCAATESRRQVQMFHTGSRNDAATTSVSGKFFSAPIVVEGLPISEILTSQEVRTVRLIKIDVEGAEFAVIQGMTSIIPKLPPDVEIIVKVSPTAPGNENLANLFGIFEQAAFFPYKIENSNDPQSYLFAANTSKLTRLRSLPGQQHICVVFSRVDADFL